ncbi:glycosyltransferase family 2 protein [Lactobacillus rodentium]|uniref:Glycosyltransferase 2-like domain-containing protein n=1 Tax=Lactobacillus rodentium TaxID=947835 RepID=A0A2Z6T912_9LACO|nr:glycosyltransferase family A protein [Lactobacillus rodentium]MCR1894761.1 glycosyltransferase family 2 protein [Lactobacillus rodentium]GBG04988.1 hypothetical protein LrDSM24759_09020 [Lactobacillus rodentium]
MNREEKVVSFIIPVYNTPLKKFQRCIDSIRKIKAIKYEIILIDDGSKQVNSEKYREYLHEDNELYVFQSNKGVSEARNKGINVSTGKYIFFVDSDDYLIAKNLNSSVFNKEKDLIIYNVIVNTNQAKKVQYFDIEKNLPTSKDLLKLALRDGIMNWSVSKFYLKKYLIKNKLKFDTNISSGEDLKFVTELLLTSPSILYVPKNLYYYDLDTNTSINRMLINPSKSIDDTIKLYFQRLKILNYLGIEDNLSLKKEAISSLFAIYANNVFKKGYVKKVYLQKINKFIDELNVEGGLTTNIKIKCLKDNRKKLGILYVKLKEIYHVLVPYKF